MMIEEILKKVVSELNLTDSTKLKVKNRYKSIVDFLTRKESKLTEYKPYIFPQGSFLYKTAIRPVGKEEEYDLDFCCCLQEGLTMDTLTQEKLKQLLGDELKEYCRINGIDSPIEEKKRCWQIKYKDGIGFHVDVLPCLPCEKEISILKSAMYEESHEVGDLVVSSESIVRWASDAILITDNTSCNYKKLMSNPEGCVKWFRARAAQESIYESVKAARVEVEDLSTVNNNSVLNSVVKILKRHRDVMFVQYPDKKPISIIISTLAAHAYQGEATIEEALLNVIPRMLEKLKNFNFEVRNPVTHAENFSDKWKTKPELQAAFLSWLTNAQKHFMFILQGELCYEKLEKLEKILKCSMSEEKERLGFQTSPKSIGYTRPVIISNPSRPWLYK